MPPEKLLTIDSSFVLTGLGVLVRSAAGADAAEPLRRFALYTTLPVELEFADGRRFATTASVEEVARSGPDGAPAPAEPALLLQLTEPLDVPPGTAVWLRAEPAATDWL